MRYTLLLLLLAACATPTTVLKNSDGDVVTCGGGTAGSLTGGLIGYTIQEGHDKDCVSQYQGGRIQTTMIKSLRAAHGLGRTGRLGINFEQREDGTKLARAPMEQCPFKGKWQFLHRFCWLEGWRMGNNRAPE